MMILTKALRNKLIENFIEQEKKMVEDGDSIDFKPVVKFFNPCGAATWLITEMDPDTNIMFGLCDLGFGTPELGYVSLDELMSIRVGFGLKIERDRNWKATKTLHEYTTESYTSGRLNA